MSNNREPIELRSSPAMPPASPYHGEPEQLNAAETGTATTASNSAGTQVPNSADPTLERIHEGTGGGSTHSNSNHTVSTAPPTSPFNENVGAPRQPPISNNYHLHQPAAHNAYTQSNQSQRQQYAVGGGGGAHNLQQQAEYLREHAGGVSGSQPYVPVRPWVEEVPSPQTMQTINFATNSIRPIGIRSINTANTISLENMLGFPGGPTQGGPSPTNATGRLAYANNVQPLSYATDLSKLSNMSIASLGDYTLTEAQRTELMMATTGGRGSPSLGGNTTSVGGGFHYGGIPPASHNNNQSTLSNPLSPNQRGGNSMMGGGMGPLGTVLTFSSYDSMVPHHGTPYTQSLQAASSQMQQQQQGWAQQQQQQGQFHHSVPPHYHTQQYADPHTNLPPPPQYQMGGAAPVPSNGYYGQQDTNTLYYNQQQQQQQPLQYTNANPSGSRFYSNVSMAQSQQDMVSSNGGGTSSPPARFGSMDGIASMSPNATPGAVVMDRNGRPLLGIRASVDPQSRGNRGGGPISDFDFDTAATQLMEHHKKSVDSLVDEWLGPVDEGSEGGGGPTAGGMLALTSSPIESASHPHHNQSSTARQHPIVMLDPSSTNRSSLSPVTVGVGGPQPHTPYHRPGGGGMIVVTTTTPAPSAQNPADPYGSFTVPRETTVTTTITTTKTYHTVAASNGQVLSSNGSSGLPSPSHVNQFVTFQPPTTASQSFLTAATSVTGATDVIHAPSYHNHHNGLYGSHRSSGDNIASSGRQGHHSYKHHDHASDPLVSDFTLVDLDAKNTRQRKKTATAMSNTSESHSKGSQQLAKAAALSSSPPIPSTTPEFNERLSTSAERAEKAIREAPKRFNVQITTNLLAEVFRGILLKGAPGSSGTLGPLLLFSQNVGSSSSLPATCVFSPPTALEPRYPQPDSFTLISLCKSEWTAADKNGGKLSSSGSQRNSNDNGSNATEDTAGRRRYDAHDPSIVSFRFHLCDKYLATGGCPSGAQCPFLHCTKGFLESLVLKVQQQTANEGTVLPPIVMCDVHFNTRVTTKPLFHRTHEAERSEVSSSTTGSRSHLVYSDMITVKNQKDSLTIPAAPIVITKGSRLVVEQLPDAPSKPQVCSHYARGLCPRGRHCCFVHYDQGPVTSMNTLVQEPTAPAHQAGGISNAASSPSNASATSPTAKNTTTTSTTPKVSAKDIKAGHPSEQHLNGDKKGAAATDEQQSPVKKDSTPTPVNAWSARGRGVGGGGVNTSRFAPTQQQPQGTSRGMGQQQATAQRGNDGGRGRAWGK